MKFIDLVFVVLVIGLLGGVADSQALKRTTTKTDTIALGAGSTVSIAGAPVGSITVTTIAGNNIQISANIEVQAANEEDLAAAAVLTGFVTQDSLGKLSIVSVGADSRRKFTDTEKKLIKRLKGMPYRIDYTIGVPRYSNVEINAGEGDVELSAPEGDHRINALNSKVKVSVPGGSLVTTIAKGELSIELPASGRRGLNIDASVASGDLSIMLPTNVSADIDATILRTGKVTNEITPLKPRDRKVPFTDKLVRATLGVGGPTIKLTVGDGNIRLEPWTLQ
ncbi:MAG: hypothetical protein JO314_12510 [Acidobacteria bacterium]|nr:hypothetical protein [Acidobacteriota bacterium]